MKENGSRSRDEGVLGALLLAFLMPFHFPEGVSSKDRAERGWTGGCAPQTQSFPRASPVIQAVC